VNAAWTRVLGGLAAALLFGVGLVLSGMCEPARVLGFLNVGGAWDPSLLGVMAGAVGVYAISFRLLRRLPRSLSGDPLAIPPRGSINAQLVAGAALFGVGWGLAGYCPGPLVVSLGTGQRAAGVFALGLVLGTFLAARGESAVRAAQRSSRPRAPA